MKLYNSSSLAEKQRMVEKNEQELIERQQQAQQQQLQVQQQQMQAEAQQKELEMQLKDQMNQRDNETKILVATISANSNQEDGVEEPEYSQEAKDKLMESMRQFDARLKLDRDKFEFDKDKTKNELRLKEKQLNKRATKQN
jgi:hypothetical protein